MAYPLSASRLQTYQRCPQSYYLRYERGMKQPGFFGVASLGIASHQTLAKVYGNWHYQQPVPPSSGYISAGKSSAVSLALLNMPRGATFWRVIIATNTLRVKST